MRKIKLALAALSFGFFSLSAQSSEIVCVNGDELLKLSSYAQQLKQEVEAKKQEILNKYQQKAKQIVEKLKALQQELSSGLLSEEAKKEKQQEFMKLQAELQSLQMQMQQELRRYITQTLQNLDKLTKAALKALAQTEHFKVAADCKSLLYYDPSVDITKEVAKVLDQLAKSAAQKAESAIKGFSNPSR